VYGDREVPVCAREVLAEKSDSRFDRLAGGARLRARRALVDRSRL